MSRAADGQLISVLLTLGDPDDPAVVVERALSVGVVRAAGPFRSAMLGGLIESMYAELVADQPEPEPEPEPEAG